MKIFKGEKSNYLYHCENNLNELEITDSCIVKLEGSDKKYVLKFGALGRSKEYDLLKKLDYPGIPKIIDKSNIEEGKFYIREYVEGKTLRQKLKEDPCCRREKYVLNCIYNASKILKYSHLQEVPHCNLGLDNIIISEKGQVNIVGFGVLKNKYDPDLKIFVEDVDYYQYDIFSLGRVMHFLLTNGRSMSVKQKKNTLGSHYEFKVDSYFPKAISLSARSICLRMLNPSLLYRTYENYRYRGYRYRGYRYEKFNYEHYRSKEISTGVLPYETRYYISMCEVHTDILDSMGFMRMFLEDSGLSKKSLYILFTLMVTGFHLAYLLNDSVMMKKLYEKGVSYEKIAKTESDLKEVRLHYEKAAIRGHRDSMSRLGVFYERGYGGEKNYNKALMWYKKAAEEGDSSVIHDIGKLYQSGGYGLEKNYNKALMWYKRALENNNKNVIIDIGEIYQEGGSRIKKNYYKALDYYLEAYIYYFNNTPFELDIIESKIYDLYDEIALSYGYEKTLEVYEQIEKNQGDNSYINIGRINISKYVGDLYKNGKNDFPQDYKKALVWYEKAAKKGNTSSMIYIGDLYSEGKNGISKDHIKALEWYEKSTKLGKKKGFIKMGDLYYQGVDGRGKNYSESLRYYKKSLDLSISTGIKEYENKHSKSLFDEEVLFKIGTLYFEGDSTLRKDWKKALQWYENGKRILHFNNIADSLNHINIYYTGGYGIKRDANKALAISRDYLFHYKFKVKKDYDVEQLEKIKEIIGNLKNE